MKRRMSPICAEVEMKSNAVGLTAVVRPSRMAVSGRRRDELAARIESAVANELVQGLGREVRNDAREEWRLQQPREPMLDRALVAGRRLAVRDFGHGPAMIPVLASNKQS